jgi:hypothetical protein
MGWMAGVQFLTGAGDFSLLHSVQTDSGAHPFSYSVVNWGSSPEGKAARGEKPTTHVYPVPRSRTMELHLHSPIHPYGVVLN